MFCVVVVQVNYHGSYGAAHSDGDFGKYIFIQQSGYEASNEWPLEYLFTCIFASNFT